MKRTARFAVVFAAIAALSGVGASASFAQAQLKGPYIVKDLAVDETSTVSHQDALEQGRNKAKLAGAQRLIDRLTLPDDRQAARQPLNPVDVAAFAGAVTTQALDKRSSTAAGYRLQSTVAQSFNPDRMRQYLESRGVPFVEAQSGKALLVPSVAGGVNANDWAAQWTETVASAGGQPATVRPREDLTVLTPYIASVEAWPRRPGFNDVSSELGRTGANHAVVAEAYGQGGQIYVRIIDLRTGIDDTSSNVIGPFPNLATARDNAVLEMERAWKTQSIVRTSGSTQVAAIAAFRDLGEWVKIRKGLEASRLVSGINVESISQAGADVAFTYAGRPDQLAADLRSRGVSFAPADGGWLLRVSQ